MKVHRLLQKGIMEQRIEVAWKYVELTCVSVTPILVSIMGNFGNEFRQDCDNVFPLFPKQPTVSGLLPV